MYSHYLPLLDKVDEYAWGEAFLAHIHYAIRSSVEDYGKDLAYSSYALQHIPNFLEAYIQKDTISEDFYSDSVPLLVGWTVNLKKFSVES
ncbi:hypothetical protein Q3G72_031750 [Acer saccharum]|nr:hypothetical protein Q3G72_031750 [Acer saccharum]